jgi:hypothetical protein
VIKANFLQKGAGRGAAVRASAQYYGHRPNQEGDRSYRDAFDDSGEGITKEQVNGYLESFDATQYEYVYRLVLSPGEDLEEGELKRWTRDVMHDVSMNYGDWVGWVHNDHTEHPHTHVLGFTDYKLSKEHFEEMRHWGDKSAQEMVEIKREMQQDPMEREQSAQVEHGRQGAREGREESAGEEEKRESAARGHVRDDQDGRSSERRESDREQTQGV